MSGLAAARVLAGCEPASGAPRQRPTGPVVLLEASARLGGKVRTGDLDGSPVELGPDQFLRRDPSAERLCRLLGLGGDLVEPAVASAAVFARGQLRRLPAGLVLGVPTDIDALAESGIVSDEAVSRLREAPGAPAPTPAEAGLRDGPEEERSAADLLRPLYGDEILDVLVDPLLGGINAGRIDSLSLGMTAPLLAEALVTGRVVSPPPRSHGQSSVFFGLKGGLSRLVTAAADELGAAGVDLRLEAGAVSLGGRSGRRGGFEITTDEGDRIECDGVVLALPAFRAASLIEETVPAAAGPLAAIEYASVAVVTYALPAATALPPGLSGFLVPRREGLLMTAATFLSEKWPWMRGEDDILVRVSAGRAGDERTRSLGEDELGRRLWDEFAALAGVAAAPRAASVTAWERAFPQYSPGHRRRIAAVESALADLPGVELAGALLGGIGLPACLSSGERAAVAVLSSITP